MKRTILLYLSVALTLPMLSQRYYGYPASEPSEWSGTGWALNNGYVVTNHHVVDNARTIRLTFTRGEEVACYSGEVAVTDEENDLAIIHINDPQFKGFGTLPYAVKTALAEVGESVFVLGYPMTSTMGDEIKLTTGIVSSHSGFQGDRSQYQISAPVQSGNSGGPLFDDDGNIIGIVSAKHREAENVSYAVKASYLTPLIDRLSDKTGVLPDRNTIAGKSLPEKVKQVKGLVCFIYCSTTVSNPRRETRPQQNPDADQGERSRRDSGNEGGKVIFNPDVNYSHADNTRITRVILTDNETIIELEANNELQSGYATSMSIAPNTVLVLGNDEFQLVRAEGIAIAPESTPYTYRGETKTFRLFFPPIPRSTTSISVVEPGSDWKFYGISLKESFY